MNECHAHINEIILCKVSVEWDMDCEKRNLCICAAIWGWKWVSDSVWVTYCVSHWFHSFIAFTALSPAFASKVLKPFITYLL